MKNQKVNVHLKYLFNLGIELKDADYIEQLDLLAKKNQIRLSQELKRNICIKCKKILIPTVTCKSEIVKETNGLFLKIKCKCGCIKNFSFRGQKGLKKTKVK
ncbi:hypothetical protein GVAV_003536 [Gurleya vavrai]